VALGTGASKQPREPCELYTPYDRLGSMLTAARVLCLRTSQMSHPRPHTSSADSYQYGHQSATPAEGRPRFVDATPSHANPTLDDRRTHDQDSVRNPYGTSFSAPQRHGGSFANRFVRCFALYSEKNGLTGTAQSLGYFNWHCS
jgi:hypothetical protein